MIMRRPYSRTATRRDHPAQDPQTPRSQPGRLKNKLSECLIIRVSDLGRGAGPCAWTGPGRGRGRDHHPQAGCLPRLPRLRGRTRNPGSQPSGPHLMAAPEIVVPGRPAVSCYPCRGANGPGRGHQDLPGADRVLRLPVLRGTAPRRSRRTPRHFLHPAASGWGQLTLTGSLPRSGRAWTGNGTPREPRSLKHRPDGAIRTIPIPPQLVRLLRQHLRTYGCAADGRLFRGARGGPLSESLYGRIWHQARAAAIPARQAPNGPPPL